MFIKSKANYIVKVVINVGKILGCATDEEAYIELREMDTQSMMKLKEESEKGESAYIDFMKGVLPSIITEHNLYKDENKLMSNTEVTELVFSKMELTSKVVADYMSQAFHISNAGTSGSDKEPRA